jgi:hypothetical protein
MIRMRCCAYVSRDRQRDVILNAVLKTFRVGSNTL